MASVSAWQRGATPTERFLMVSLSAAVVLAVHLLPALVRRWTVWPLWCVCLLCAVYGHAVFFASAADKVAEDRGQNSPETRAVAAQMAEVRETLASVRARPVAQVSALLAVTRNPRRHDALVAELEEAHRAAWLRDQLIHLSASQVSHAVVTDPVTAQVAQVTGISTAAVSLAISVAMAVTLELVGLLLWREVFSPDDSGRRQEIKPPGRANRPHMVRQPSSHATDASASPVRDLQRAIRDGTCKGTVAGIREYLRCSQGKAMLLRRELSNLLVTSTARPVSLQPSIEGNTA